MNESIKSNFEIFLENHQPKKETGKQYLNDWSHLYLSQESCPNSYNKIITKYPPMTRTTNAIVSILLPETPKIPGSINRSLSSIIFWSTISSQNTPEINLSEINHAISTGYKSHFTRINLNICTDTKTDICLKYLKDTSNRDLNKRTLVHFISDLSPEFNSPQKKAEQFRQLREIIKHTLHCGVHIIDCDMAGIYYQRYLDIFKETEFTMQHQNLFVFFSCLENQKVPKLPGLPSDLFSSFLISPAKTALLCHSWHYFCFNHNSYTNFNDDSNFSAKANKTNNHDISQQQKQENNQWSDNQSQLFFRSSLSAITIEQINSAPKNLLDNIMNSLRRIVEAMLCDSDFFSIFFKIDETVADLFTGFAVAQRFFSSFQVKPFSYPSFPDTVANHPLWSTFDLRLDAALMTLIYGSTFNNSNLIFNTKNSSNSKSSDDTHTIGSHHMNNLYSIDSIPFAQQELQTVKLLIESQSPLSTFSGHISFMSDCLVEPGLMNDSISTLASFIDAKGLPAIQMASKFPIFPSLVKIAKSTINDRKSKEFVIDGDIDTRNLLLCMSKLYAFYPNAKDLVPFFSNQYLTSFTVFHLRSENPLPALVLFTLMAKMGDSSMATLFLKCNWLSIVESLIQSPSEDVRVWTLLLVSSFAKHVNLANQALQLLDAISGSAEDTSSLVRVSLLVALQSFPFSNSAQIESSVLEVALRLMDDMNPAVRRELAALLVLMRAKYLQKATSYDERAAFSDKMTPSTSMSTSDFFSESGSDMNLDSTSAASSSYKSPSNLPKQKQNVGSFSFSTKSEMNKIISEQEAAVDGSSQSGGSLQNSKIIASALKILATDPFKGVLQTAREVTKSFTFMFFFDRYISPPKAKTHFSPSMGEFSSSQKILIADTKKVKIENFFTMKHVIINSSSNQCITSNVTFSPVDDQLIFGTDSGHIISHPMQVIPQSPSKQDKSVLQGFTSQSPITHVQCVKNNGFPLLLISNNSGDFFAGDLCSSHMNQKANKIPILASFRIFLGLRSTEVVSSKNKNNFTSLSISSSSSSSSFWSNCDFKEPAKRSYEFEFVSRDSRIFFYVPKTGCNVNMYDLVAEQKIGEIRSVKDNITAVHSPSFLSDCVAVCDEDFLLYDCRASMEEPVLTYVPKSSQTADLQFNRIYSCKSFKKEPFLMPFCTYGGSVIYNDMRMMMNVGGGKKQCVFDCTFNDAQTLCFDVNQETLTAAVGSTKGASVFFYPGDKKIIFPNKQKLAQPVFRLKWMPRKFGLVIMQNYTDIQTCTFY